ncbi:MAG: hypothetical protein WB819_08660, partial [Terriglobia bacterium]
DDLLPGTKNTEPMGWQEKLPSDIAPDSAFPLSTVSKRTSAIPPKVLFGALHSPVLRLVKPIPLKTEKTKDTVSVVWEEVSEFGCGGTFSEALFDFAATITELFVALSEQESLGNDLLRVKSKLSEYIELRPR